MIQTLNSFSIHKDKCINCQNQAVRQFSDNFRQNPIFRRGCPPEKSKSAASKWASSSLSSGNMDRQIRPRGGGIPVPVRRLRFLVIIISHLQTEVAGAGVHIRESGCKGKQQVHNVSAQNRKLSFFCRKNIVVPAHYLFQTAMHVSKNALIRYKTIDNYLRNHIAKRLKTAVANYSE